MNEEKIGNFILELRKEKNMTQEELAIKLHVDRGTVSKWERGIYLPKPDLLLEMSKIFEVSVNEILLGERKTKENIEKLNMVTVDVMNKGRKKVKKFCLLLGFTILLLVLSFSTLFLGKYFMKNYNSISVHQIYGENENFSLENTLAIVSTDYISLIVGGIKNNTNEKIYDMDIYYKKGGEKYWVTSNTGFISFSLTEFGFPLYENLNYFKQNLYMDITYGSDKKVDTIKLIVSKEFANDKIQYRNKASILPIQAEEIEYSIPDYMKKYCKLDLDYNQYICKSTRGNNEIEEYYNYVDSYYWVEENSKDFYLKKYILKEEWLEYEYYEKDGNDLKEKFHYNLSTKECSGICDEDIVEYFKSKYLSHIEIK